MSTPESIAPADITGLVLAGGLARRMGGVDKGLMPWRGAPMAAHALKRLAPQVGALLINANRHLDTYQTLGVPVVSDTVPGFPGPLAGLLAGLRAARTPYLACVPCDSPLLPDDLVARLAIGLSQAHADAAIAAAPADDAPLRRHPVFALLRCTLANDLARYLNDGGHKVETWLSHHTVAQVRFEDGRPFYNINTREELIALEQSGPAHPSTA